jgi:uncharacterized damage-inducible protein DinB
MSIVRFICDQYCLTHEHALKLSNKLSDEQLRSPLAMGGHSVAFHLWHMARWADHFQAAIPGMTPELEERLGPRVQLWDAENLLVHWGFASLELGQAETGMTMSDDLAAQLTFPVKEVLLAYVQKAFALAKEAVNAIDDEQFQASERPQSLTAGIWKEGTVGSAILAHIIHDNRHLGMMECLLGSVTGSGTATI